MRDNGYTIDSDEEQKGSVGAHFHRFYARFSTPEWLIAARVRTRPSKACLFGPVGFLSLTCSLPTACVWQSRWMLAVVDHSYYTPGVMILVLLNMIALCTASADMVRLPCLGIHRKSPVLASIFWFTTHFPDAGF